MKITNQSSLIDVAYIVCTALDEAGINAVLTGGSAATFYAPASYQSFDLDFHGCRTLERQRSCSSINGGDSESRKI